MRNNVFLHSLWNTVKYGIAAFFILLGVALTSSFAIKNPSVVMLIIFFGGILFWVIYMLLSETKNDKN